VGKRVAIIDSGVYTAHPAFAGKKITGLSLFVDSQGHAFTEDGFEDEIGHGTAVFYIIDRFSQNVEITNIKIYKDRDQISQESFEIILEYILHNMQFDIINISLGIVRCGCTLRLRRICSEFKRRGTIIISAFDNDGAVSVPAALENVIGIDGCVYSKAMKADYTRVRVEEKEISTIDFEPAEAHMEHQNSIVDVVGKLKYIKVAWRNPDYILVQGNSFLAANFTALAAGIDYTDSEDLLNKICSEELLLGEAKKNDMPFAIKEAAVFPFNKEIHAIARFEELLICKIADYYTIRVMGNVGTRVGELVPASRSDKILKDIKHIEWDKFDTLIIGHTDECSNITGVDYKGWLIEEATARGKNIYLFDDIGSNHRTYYPRVCEDMLQKRFGKLYKIDKPVLTVAGTNSKQGKYTLQLELRKRFMELGYKVGQIGTEPTAPLFGMDEVFPCGYNGTVKLNPEQTFVYVNQMLHNITEKNPDIIIAGAQTALLGYNDNNVYEIPLYHRIFFEALKPDAVIMCINAYDDREYVIRSIKTAEGLSGGRVIALVCFPVENRNRWQPGAKLRSLPPDRRKEVEEQYKDYKVYWPDIKEDISDLTKICIDFFSGE